MLQQAHSFTGLGKGQALRSALLTLAIVAAAVWQQARLGLNTDVSWLMIVGERVLGGVRLYVDIFEVNPPASVWLYLPQMALAQGTGLHAEAVVAASVFLMTGLAMLFSGAILLKTRTVSQARAIRLLPVVTTILLFVPGAGFAQREQWAVLFLLPWLALMVARQRRARVPWLLVLAAGLGAGVTIAIKPPFALAAGLPLLWSAWRQRHWQALCELEVFAAASVVGSYVLAVVIFYPEYLTGALPLLRDSYLPVRDPLAVLLGNPYVLMTAVTATAALLFARRLASADLVGVLALAALGFFLAMLSQGKGYLNHNQPAGMLALLALAVPVLLSNHRDKRRLGAGLLLLSGGWLAFPAATVEQYREMTALVQQVGPKHPSLIVAATNLSIGHPLTWQVAGRWVGTRGALWATGTATGLLQKEKDPAKRARLKSIIDEDRALFIADVKRGQPDLVLTDRANGFSWIARHPDVATALRGYCIAGEAEGLVLLRRDEPTTPSPRETSAPSGTRC